KEFEVHLFHTKHEKVVENQSKFAFDKNLLDDYQFETLKEAGVFNFDMVVVSTGDEFKNEEIATFTKENGVERVIARTEVPAIEKRLKELGIDVFSVLLSAKTLLKALIEAPNVVNIFTEQDSALYEINMNNSQYDGTLLREFPFSGDVIMVRI